MKEEHFEEKETTRIENENEEVKIVGVENKEIKNEIVNEEYVGVENVRIEKEECENEREIQKGDKEKNECEEEKQILSNNSFLPIFDFLFLQDDKRKTPRDVPIALSILKGNLTTNTN